MSTPKKILVVDDEADVLSYLEMLLRDNGYEIITATNGRDALDKFNEHKPDLVTLDISMPEKSGAGFYKTVKQNPETAAVPVVVITAITGYDGDPRAYEKFLSSRMTVPAPEGFFPKPINRDELVSKVKELLG